MIEKFTDQQLTDLAARVLLLEAAVVGLATGMRVRELLAELPDGELEQQLRAMGASDTAFRLRDMLKAPLPDA